MDKARSKRGLVQSGCDLVWHQKEFPDPNNTKLVQSSPFQVLCTKLVQSPPFQFHATPLEKCEGSLVTLEHRTCKDRNRHVLPKVAVDATPKAATA